MPAQAEVHQLPASPLRGGRAAAGYGWAAIEQAGKFGVGPSQVGSQMYGTCRMRPLPLAAAGARRWLTNGAAGQWAEYLEEVSCEREC